MNDMTRARLLVGIELLLLAEPEELGNDALEGDLYILRDQLNAGQGREVKNRGKGAVGR